MSFGITSSQGTGADGGSGSSAYATAVMQDNPTIFLKFDEVSGATAEDSSGNGHDDGSYIGSPYLQQYSVIPGSTGRSARFENSNGGNGAQRVTVPYGSWMDTSEVTVTFACFASAGNYRLMATRYGEPGDDWSWYVYVNNGTFQFHYRSALGVNTNIDSGVTVETGKRYFIAAYAGVSGCGIRVYDATGLIGSATGAGGDLNPSSRSITLMDAETGNYSQTGYLDGFAVFDTVLSTARLDTYGNHAMAVDAVTWTHRSAGTLARNGTTDHTISFTPATAGSLLVVVVGGAITSDAVTPGWTKRLAPTNSTQLAIFTRNANAGDSSLQITHNNTNFPGLYVAYEFPPGSAWCSGASLDNIVGESSYPTLSGLPGIGNVSVFAATSGSRAIAESNNTPTQTNWYYFWTTDSNQNVLDDGATSGCFMSIGYFINFPDTSADVLYPAQQYISNDIGPAALFAIVTP